MRRRNRGGKRGREGEEEGGRRKGDRNEEGKEKGGGREGRKSKGVTRGDTKLLLLLKIFIFYLLGKVLSNSYR